MQGDPTAALTLIVVGRGLVSAAHFVQRIRVTVAGRTIAEWIYSTAEPGGMRVARIPKDVLRTGRPIHVVLVTPDAVSPRAIGLSQDDRQLALAVTELRALQSRTDLPLLNDTPRE